MQKEGLVVLEQMEFSSVSFTEIEGWIVSSEKRRRRSRREEEDFVFIVEAVPVVVGGGGGGGGGVGGGGFCKFKVVKVRISSANVGAGFFNLSGSVSVEDSCWVTVFSFLFFF